MDDIFYILFMMIRIVVQNSEGSIELFHKYQAYHLMRESHFGK